MLQGQTLQVTNQKYVFKMQLLWMILQVHHHLTFLNTMFINFRIYTRCRFYLKIRQAIENGDSIETLCTKLQSNKLLNFSFLMDLQHPVFLWKHLMRYFLPIYLSIPGAQRELFVQYENIWMELVTTEGSKKNHENLSNIFQQLVRTCVCAYMDATPLHTHDFDGLSYVLIGN